jgi:hypothetical protein
MFKIISANRYRDLLLSEENLNTILNSSRKNRESPITVATSHASSKPPTLKD